MIPYPYGPMLGQVDCESVRDFSQYYRARYFCIKPNTQLAEIRTDDKYWPCFYQEAIAREAQIILGIWNPNTENLTFTAPTFKEITQACLFGHPMQGTCEFWFTYDYIKQPAYRESIKGVGLNRLMHHIPQNGNAIIKAYSEKHPEFTSVTSGRTFGTIPELQLVSKIYNKWHYGWHEAIQLLERGDRLGCQISLKSGLYIEEGNPLIQLSYKDTQVGEIIGDNVLRIHAEARPLMQVINEQIPGNIRMEQG